MILKWEDELLGNDVRWGQVKTLYGVINFTFATFFELLLAKSTICSTSTKENGSFLTVLLTVKELYVVHKLLYLKIAVNSLMEMEKCGKILLRENSLCVIEILRRKDNSFIIYNCLCS